MPHGDTKAPATKLPSSPASSAPSKRLNVNDPFDPIENIEGGVRYIKELLATFEGNLTNAIAAYNAGPAAVRKYGGIPPYQETRQYVRRVLDLYRQYSAVE